MKWQKKNVLVKLTEFHFTHTKIQTLIPKLLFVKFLRITTKGELEVVFIFCNYCFLSLPCSSSWSIISVILDICCPLSLKRHRHFPASLVFLIHTLLQTFLPVCTMASDTCRSRREIQGTAIFSFQPNTCHQVDTAASHRPFSSELREGATRAVSWSWR